MQPQNWVELAVTIIGAVFASNGFWALWQSRSDKNDAKNQMILGLGHDRIIYLCRKYLEDGYISHDDFENLHDYLYIPYDKMGGNGSAKRLMEEVKKLPIK